MRAAPRYPSFGTFARTPERFLMSVLSKRSYRWSGNGGVIPLDEQPSLALDQQCVTRPDRNCEVLVQGRDTWPLKRATDVIVTGHARPAHGLPVLRQDVEVSVGAHKRQVVAFGPRYVDYRREGIWFFTPPEAFLEVALSWWNAYGGVDPAVLPKGLDDTPLLAGKPILELFPGAYPRNPCGTGYLIEETRRYLEGLALPQLEDPAKLLEPQQLLVKDASAWWKRPSPACFGWYHTLWYPRILHTGGKPYHLPPTAANPDTPEEEQQPLPRLHMTSEAAPELILPFLSGEETVALSGFGTREAQRFRLPRERPRVTARADGIELSQVESRIHTLAVDADKQQFYLLFSERFEIPDELAGDLSAGLTRADVLTRCHVQVDGYALGPEDWPAVEEE